LKIEIQDNVVDEIFLSDFDELNVLGEKQATKTLPEYARMAAILRKLFLDHPSLVEILANRFKTRIWVLKVHPIGWDVGSGELEKVPKAFIDSAPPKSYMGLPEADLQYYTFRLKTYLETYQLGVVFGIVPTPAQVIKYYANFLGGVHLSKNIDVSIGHGRQAASIHAVDQSLTVGERTGARWLLDKCAYDLYHAALPFSTAIRQAKSLEGKHSTAEIKYAAQEWFRSTNKAK
jgi:hypothetical protein